MSLIFKRFLEIDQDYLLSDMHIHSTWSDGKNSVREIIEYAEKIGLKSICITDHIRKTSDYYAKAYAEINELKKNTNLTVYSGFEAKINNFQGHLDVSPENLRLCDLSIASVHRFPIGRQLREAREFDKKNAQIIELELSIAAIHAGGFSVLGHPGGMSIRSHGEFELTYFEEIIRHLSSTDIAFDFNASYHSNYKQELVVLFEKYNPYVSIGSDAHKIDKLGNGRTLFEHTKE